MGCLNPKSLALASTLCIIGSVVLRWGIVDPVIHSQIDKVIQLEPGTQVWDFWTNIPIPIFIKFYFFNVSNPEEIQRGAKPILKEVGPYVYEEKRSKIILRANDERIRYRPKTVYYYRQDLSYGTEDDYITMLNVPFVAVARMAWDMTKEPLILSTLDGMMREKKEPLFHTHKVRDYLFEGVSIENFMELLTLPVADLIGENIKVPERFLDGKFGFFDDKNGTADELWEVTTGKFDKTKFAQVVSLNEMTKMDKWGNEKCDRIAGTDGTLFPPFATQNSILTAYSPQLCRTVGMVFKKHGEFMGLQTLRFGYPDSLFGSLLSYPENECYCKTSKKFCEQGGIASLAPCLGGAPVYASLPHFSKAHKDFAANVEGLFPSEDYATEIDVEPRVGLPFRGSLKIQINIHLEPYDSMETFSSVPNLIFPLLWAEETATITEELASPIKLLVHGLAFVDFLTAVILTISTLILIVAFIAYSTSRRWKPET